MKKLLIIFLTLILAFMGTWIYKTKTPKTRPDSFQIADYTAGAWWNTSDTVKAASDYTLDSTVEDNYVPCPGEKNLFMEIDDDGNIVRYHQRTKQKDGSYTWKVVNPDIPEDYEPVNGLDNVYKCTKDGKTKYYKYIRNDDDTYAFIEVDKNGKVIDKDIQDNNNGDIPDNYKRIKGTNIYAVYNDNGVIIAYKERKFGKNNKYYWVDAEKPKTTDTDGNSSTSYKFPLSDLGVGYYNGNQTNVSQDNKRIQNEEKAKNNQSAPQVIYIRDKNSNSHSSGGSHKSDAGKTTQSAKSVERTKDGYYTDSEIVTNNVIEGNYKITYQTIIIKKYNAEGKLVSTKKGKPTQVAKVQISNDSSKKNSSEKNKVKKSLSAEYNRVTSGVSFNDSLANKVLGYINSMRQSNRVASLNTNSTAVKLAKIKVADMVKNNYCSFNSPTYGTIYDMCTKFNLNSKASEGEFKVISESANTIANRVVSSCSNCISNQFSKIGIGIIKHGEYNYVCVIVS